MLDLGLAVIDRLITLVKGRIESRKEMFAQVIEPVFTDLITIHGDHRFNSLALKGHTCAETRHGSTPLQT
jgi:hypothetical protein